MPGPAWLGPVASQAAGYMFGGLGGWAQNAENKREAEKNRAFQAGEAGKMRDFQERMRNTEWQAAVADMEAAGINPAVAYSKGGASSPAGAMGSGSQSAPMGNVVSSAMQMKLMQNQLALTSAQVQKAVAEARSAKNTADLDEARRHWMLNLEGNRNAPARDMWEAELARSIAEASRASSMSDISGVGAGYARVIGGFQDSARRIGGVAQSGMDRVAGGLEFLQRLQRLDGVTLNRLYGISKFELARIINRIAGGR